jgi:hypothetical protein
VHAGICVAVFLAATRCQRYVSCVGCRYETWRKHRLAGPGIGAKLKRFAITTVLPVGVALYAAQRGINIKQVRTVIDKKWRLVAVAWLPACGGERCICT